MFEIRSITDEEYWTLLALEEGQRLDFKSMRIRPSKLSETISAFANTDGGELYVGIEDDRTWQGFDNTEAANEISAMIFDMFPVQDYIECNFLKSDAAGLVLKIEIARTPDIKEATNGSIFKRFGAQNRKLTNRTSIQQLEFSKGVRSYEDELIDGDLSEIENSATILDFALSIIPHPEPAQWLRKQRFVVGERGSVGGYMLFSEEPQIYIGKSGVKIYRYRTADLEGSRANLAFDPITVEGPIIDLIRKSVSITKEKVQDVPKIGEAGLESIVYPEEAIHEVVTNAVIHRDYSVSDEVHIRIFDNRIEVFSPGKLPGYVTAKNILTERFARNPRIVRIINKFPNAPNKDVGEGLNTAFEKMRELKLRDPVIAETEAGVTVTLYHELLASPEKLVKDYLEENEEINNSKARELCREGSENRMKRVFEKMMDAGILERIPGRRGRATAYRLKK